MDSRTLLILSSIKSNKLALIGLLGNRYQYYEADSWTEALDILGGGAPVSAAIVDVSSDEGFHFLTAISKHPLWDNLPAIAVCDNPTGEIAERACELGAIAAIGKPYNEKLLCPIIENLLKLAASQHKFCANPDAPSCPLFVKYDNVTGLFSREMFCQEAAAMILLREPGYFVFSCYNIENFKIINDQYGIEKGDDVLRYVGSLISECVEKIGGICCRYTSDRFAALYPAVYKDSKLLADCHKKAQEPDCISRKITIRVGRYVVVDKELPVGNMYDRAAIAEESIHGKYDVFVADYEESMRERLLEEQQIVASMHDALRSGEFETWLQPQYNHATGELIGAEALVRWRKQPDVIVPPSVFIPVFERNGFIYELDKFVWEEVCKLQRRWIDEGHTPLPISVNISRNDVLMPDFIDVLTGLVEKYRINPELIRLEITETAFTQQTEIILSVFKKLISLGFTVEIDDFGSGYSSLNTLKDMPANILKLDMKFLETSDDSKRGGIILESVVRMARWLDMEVIAEGVETLEQAEYLRSIGCRYVQGYLYAKPMTVPEYEELLKKGPKKLRASIFVPVSSLTGEHLWDPKSMDTLIFNSFIGGACIIEVHEGRLELLRANEKYVRVLGSAGMTVADALKLEWTNYLDDYGRAELFEAMHRSIETGDEVTSEFVFYRLPGCGDKTYLRITLRVIAYCGDRLLVYATLENVTDLRLSEAEKKAAADRHKVAAKQLEAIVENINGGILAFSLEDGVPRLIFANEEFYRMLGYTQEQLCREVPGGIIDLINPHDAPEVRRAVSECEKTGERKAFEFRVRRRGGSEIWVYCTCSVSYLEGIENPVFVTALFDITEPKHKDKLISPALSEPQPIV